MSHHIALASIRGQRKRGTNIPRVEWQRRGTGRKSGGLVAEAAEKARGQGEREGGKAGTAGRLMVHLSSWQRRFAAHLLLHRHSSALGGGPLAASAGIRTRVTIHRVGQRARRRLSTPGRAFRAWRDLSCLCLRIAANSLLF